MLCKVGAYREEMVNEEGWQNGGVKSCCGFGGCAPDGKDEMVQKE